MYLYIFSLIIFQLLSFASLSSERADLEASDFLEAIHLMKQDSKANLLRGENGDRCLVVFCLKITLFSKLERDLISLVHSVLELSGLTFGSVLTFGFLFSVVNLFYSFLKKIPIRQQVTSSENNF